MVDVEVHSAGERVKRLELLDVHGERCVPTAAGLTARPLRAGQHRNRASLDIGEGDATLLAALGKVHQPPSGPPLQLAKALDGQPAVAGPGERQNGIGHALRRVDRWTALRRTGIHHSELGGQLGHLLARVHGDALRGQPQSFHQGAQRCPFLGDGRVVPLHHGQRAHGLARHRSLAGAAPITFDASRIRHGTRGIVLQRAEHHIGAGAKVFGCQRAERTRNRAERLEVGMRLPRRVHRGCERVHERVHVGAGQVVLLVPGRRGQHYVGQQRRRRHPEVDRHQQV